MTIIKICGIKTLEDARVSVEAGADYLGFNFYPKSPRFIQPEACAAITAVLKNEHPAVRLVGVFVNSPMDEVRSIMDSCTLDLAQLHGDETAGFRAQLGMRAFKAFRGVPDGETEAFARTEAPAFLVDSSVKGVYGGTGTVADWRAAAELARKYPLLLAGGLRPENVAEAVRQVNPWGVDTASGVESIPGLKDEAKIKEFVAAVRQVESK